MGKEGNEECLSPVDPPIPSQIGLCSTTPNPRKTRPFLDRYLFNPLSLVA